jgi:hypothetical protein
MKRHGVCWGLMVGLLICIPYAAHAQDAQVMQLVYFNDYAPFSWENEQFRSSIQAIPGSAHKNW